VHDKKPTEFLTDFLTEIWVFLTEIDPCGEIFDGIYGRLKSASQNGHFDRLVIIIDGPILTE